MLPPGLLSRACSASILIQPKTTSPGAALPTMSWVLVSIINQDKTPQTCLPAHLIEHSSVEVSSSHMALIHVKSTRLGGLAGGLP